MKVAIMSLSTCESSPAIIDYFIKEGFNIDCVIIEKSFRKKFSRREISYRKTHDRFNRITKKYSRTRRIARYLWDFIPVRLKAYMQTNIYHIPLLNKYSIRRFCDKRGITTLEVRRHSSEETTQLIQQRGIDYILLASSNWLLKEPVISIPTTKIINGHLGLLPKHKGLDSIPWALLEGDKVGVTTHFIESGVDNGAILKFFEVKVEKGDGINAIKKKASALKPRAFYETLTGLGKGEIIPQPQDDKYEPHSPIAFDQLLALEKKLQSRMN